MVHTVHQVIRDHYAAAAVRAQQAAGCCSAAPEDPISRGLYSDQVTA